MADEQNASTNEGIKTDGEPAVKQDDSQITVDKAELETLKAQAGRMEDLDKIAKEASNDGEDLTTETYLTLLEDHVYNDPNKKSDPEPEKKPAVTPDPEKSKVTPTPDPNAEEAKRLALQAQQTANTTALAVQYQEFKDLQRDLPEDQRSSLTKAELQKMIMSETDQPTIMAVARKKFDNNVYVAANYIHALMNADDLITKAKKEGADSEAAKEAARNSAQLPGNSGRMAEPTAKTPQEKAQEENDRLADEIAPDTVFVPIA